MAPIGLWGKPTATIDWCEENYVVTSLIAEFWNTISNVVMIIPPAVTIILLLQQRLERRFIFCHVGLLCVGLGSWCFHMTLLYSMQLFDELPMIWGSAFMVYSFVEVKSPPRQYNIPLGVALFLYCFLVTIIYTSTNYVILFQIAYGVMVAGVVLCSVWTSVKMDCCHKLFGFALVTYMTGFLMWNMDNHLCKQLQVFRVHNDELSPLSQFHAWWHLLAGLGTYLSLLFVAHTRCLVLNKIPVIKFWMRFWPYVSLDPKLHSHIN